MWSEGSLPRLSFVLGKGGVGKSTLSAALAVAAQRQGARVLAVEVGEATGLARMFGVVLRRPAQAERSASGVAVVRFEGGAALREFLTRVLHLGLVLGSVLRSPLYSAFVDAAPGLMTAGKIHAELLLEKDGQRSRWDWVVVDAGASGHALELLRTPRVMAETFAAGMVRQHAISIRDLYCDPRRTMVHVVATPEEMPVAEAIATVSGLRALGLPVGPVFLNRCRAAAPAGVKDALARLADLGTVEARSLLLAARRELGWVQLQEQEVTKLTEGTGLPLIAFPRIASMICDPGVLKRFANILQDGLS